MAIESRFTHDPERLRGTAASVLEYAARRGASACECEVSEGYGLTVSVRKGAVDTLEHNRDKTLGVTVYLGERPAARRGHAGSSDFSRESLERSVDAALAIARHTAVDDCAGPPEPAMLARETPDLDLFHPWHIEPAAAIDVARRCEAAGFALSRKVRNSEGATLTVQHTQFVLANSLGFAAGFPTSRHALWCTLIAEDRGGMQRDDWYSSARDRAQVADPEALGRYAAERALARLGARKIATCRVPVLFEAPLACELIGTFTAAVSGGSLYRKASFLLDSLGQPVFSPRVTIEERPLERGGLASSPFDDEGVATQTREVVRDGVLQGYFLGSYSARKLGMQSTGSAGGHHNLIVRQGAGPGPDLATLLKTMRRGLLVTELLGHGVNLVTGDYSRGAAGYWVDEGEIRHPVEEVTIAGNLREMFRNVAVIGGDTVVRGARRCGSILIEGMTVAGS